MPPLRKKPSDPERQLMIKTKTCQRLQKEVSYYRREAAENEEKLAKMKSDDAADSYDVKKFEEVVGESHMMIPDSTSRFEKSLEELGAFLDGFGDALDVEGEWYVTATSILRDNGLLSAPAGTGKGDDGGRDDDAVVVETNVEGLKEGEAF